MYTLNNSHTESEKQTGIMLLLKDEKNGGLKIRTIINTTLC